MYSCCIAVDRTYEMALNFSIERLVQSATKKLQAAEEAKLHVEDSPATDSRVSSLLVLIDL